MDYSRIRLLANKQRLTLIELSAIIGVTTHGLKYKFDNETFTVKDIESLAKYFNVSFNYFLEENLQISESKVVQDPCHECIKNETIIKELRYEIKAQKEEIAMLNRELGRRQPGERAKAG